MKRLTLFALLMLAAVASPAMADSDAPAGSPSPRAASQRADEAEPLWIQVYPRIVSNGYVSVRLRVEPNALSRTMEVSWWSTDGLGGSRILEVDGNRAAIRYEFPIKRIDPGEYEVSVVLTRADGTRIRRSATVLVVGRDF
jgi:hypothetical protein